MRSRELPSIDSTRIHTTPDDPGIILRDSSHFFARAPQDPVLIPVRFIRQINRMVIFSCTNISMTMEEPDHNSECLADDITDTLSSYGIPPSEQREISLLIRSLIRIPDISAVYLHGSYARREPKNYSDIDIAVITRSRSRSIKEEIGSYASRYIDIQEFSDLPMPAQFRVFSEGIPLFIRNQDEQAGLISQLISEYLDFEPTRNRFMKRLVKGELR